jgi:carboxyl-terminal processing protease
MQSKSFRVVLGVLVAVILVCGSFAGGFLAGWVVPQHGSMTSLTSIFTATQAPSPLQSGTPQAKSTPVDTQTLFKPFWEAWDLVHQYYVDQPVDEEKMMQGAIKGMMESLGDKHTSYIDPETLRQTNIQLEGEYSGIGAWVDTTGATLTITSPMPDSPAEKAGLKAGDQIIAVDGKDVTGILPSEVLKKVLGPAGSKVTLTIQREGTTDPFDVTITRAKIEVPSVTSKMLDNNIAYIQLTTFGDKTEPELHKALTEMLSKNPKGLILDLRSNGGGYLTSAIDVASEFLKDGVVLYEQYGSGELKTYNVNGNGLAYDIPMVVLVNEGSASASEIVAGALQDDKRASLVGVTTYGKGSVQNWVNLSNDEGAVRITMARWLTPLKRQINEKGLTPDFEVKLTEADITANNDTQLQKAIDLLSK